MSTGTFIIQSALQKIGAHSLPSPANPEAISLGRDVLNSMLQEWESRYIFLGAVPLNDPGDELSEPMDARNAIINCLALELQPDFPNKNTSLQSLTRNANRGEAFIKRMYRNIPIPKRGVSSTMPWGAGNKPGRWGSTFAGPDETVDG